MAARWLLDFWQCTVVEIIREGVTKLFQKDYKAVQKGMYAYMRTFLYLA